MRGFVDAIRLAQRYLQLQGKLQLRCFRLFLLSTDIQYKDCQYCH